MTEPALFAYLDHSVLDRMTKGDPDGVARLLERVSLIPVFSDENLREIRRSTGYEQTFLELLERIEARYLVPVLDTGLKHTGDAEFRKVSPFDAYCAYVDNVNSVPDHGFGLAGMLEKFYGGREDESFTEIFRQGIDELGQLLRKLEEGLEDIPGLDDRARHAYSELLSSLPGLMREQYRSFAEQLDAKPDVFVKQLEQVSGLGPKVLKNIRGPNVVRKIWERVEASFPGVAGTFETFFGIKPFPFEADANREKTTIEKVNGIYHQLNFLGYYRDSSMSKQRRFVASFSDMTHAGLATFCRVLICRDEDLVMKAAAAYEFLDVRTLILHYGDNKSGNRRSNGCGSRLH